MGIRDGLPLVIALVAVAAHIPAVHHHIAGSVPGQGNLAVAIGRYPQVIRQNQAGAHKLNGFLTAQGQGVSGIQGEGVHFADGKIGNLHRVPLEGDFLGFLPLGFIVNRPAAGLIALHGEVQNHGTVLGAAYGGEGENIGGGIGGEHIGGFAGELMEAADIQLDGIDGAGTQVGEDGGAAA